MASKPLIRFGLFELDLAARELRKRGVRVRLQDQPFRVLEALLEKPGEIVTRDELKERLWAEDEFVEFDKSLNTSVQKIRQALGDSADSPRYLETVPRLGYRFLAPADSPSVLSSSLTLKLFKAGASSTTCRGTGADSSLSRPWRKGHPL